MTAPDPNPDHTTRVRGPRTASTLAMFGGKPAFAQPVHVGRPNIGDRQRIHELLDEILERRWLSNAGPCVQELERQIAMLTGAKHCIATCNGTVALEIAARAVGLTGGEVIVPSFTFVATAHALLWQGMTPVFCDIDPRSHTIDPARVEELITPNTTGIMGVHLWGRPCDIRGLASVAGEHGLRLLFDASHALGCSYEGEMIGNFGDAEVFSLHATKFVNAFEGGAIVTNDDELARTMRHMKSFGFVDVDEVALLGINGKMHEVSAAMGLVSLEGIDRFVAVNYRNYKTYERNLSSLPGVSLLTFDEHEKGNYQYIVIELDPEVTGIDRDTLVEILKAENVLARRYFYPACHNMEPYRTMFPGVSRRLPHTDRTMRGVVVLPTGTAVTERDIDEICAIIRVAVTHSTEISQLLSKGARRTRSWLRRGLAETRGRRKPRDAAER